MIVRTAILSTAAVAISSAALAQEYTKMADSSLLAYAVLVVSLASLVYALRGE